MQAEQRPEEEPGNLGGFLMRVIVDETLCEANGFCESLAPDVFEIGKADVVHVADGEVPEHLEIDVRAAVDQCPKAALRLVD